MEPATSQTFILVRHVWVGMVLQVHKIIQRGYSKDVIADVNDEVAKLHESGVVVKELQFVNSKTCVIICDI